MSEKSFKVNEVLRIEIIKYILKNIAVLLSDAKDSLFAIILNCKIN